MAVLSTFAALALVSVGQVRSVADDLRRIKDELLGLARLAAQLETHQQNRFRDLRRALEEEDPRNQAVILRVGLAYYPDVIRSTLAEMDQAMQATSTPRGSRRRDDGFSSDLRTRTASLEAAHEQLDDLTRELLRLMTVSAEVQDVVAETQRLEVALRSESYRLTKRINDQMELAVRRAVRAERNAVWRILAVTLAALGLGLLVMALAARALAPIGRLAEYARALSRGDYDRELDVAKAGELGQLAEELSLMARARKHREQDLDRQAQELERAYRRVEELKRYHESIVRSLRTGVVVVDHDLRIASTNRAAQAVWGLERDAPKSLTLAETEVGRALKTSIGPDLASEASTRTLESLPIGGKLADVTIAPLEDEAGQNLGLVISLEDVTETVRTKEALIRSERLAAIGRMSAHVTHEIRNPLSSIGLNAEMLSDWVARQPDSVEPSELCQIIGEEIDRLTELTDEYLRFARLPRPEVQKIDLPAFLRGMTSFLKHDFAASDIDVQLEVDSGAVDAWADPDQLRQALLNLVRNAKEAMPRGGTLTLGCRRDGDAVIINVKDEGVGIPQDAVDRIFDPFYSTKVTGTGLGLALTHQIVQEHGGRLKVQSQPGEGTEFEITLYPPAQTPADHEPAKPSSAIGPRAVVS